MQIHRIRGRDLGEALERARELHGAGAYVLSHERMADGAVTVAVGLDRPVLRVVERRRDPRFADVERALRRSGGSDALIASTLARLARSGASGTHALDAAAQILGQRVALAQSPKLSAGSPRPIVLAFVGPAGVGKTTTVAKLAIRLARAGRRVGLMTLDDERPGASALLAGLVTPLQTSLDAIGSAAELREAIERSGSRDVVLVDSAGDASRDVGVLSEVSQSLQAEQRGGVPATYLVVAAPASRSALAEVAEAYAGARPCAAVVTKLDETRVPAAALEFAADSGLPLAFLCDGRDIAGHLHRPDPERIADLFLRGRLA